MPTFFKSNTAALNPKHVPNTQKAPLSQGRFLGLIFNALKIRDFDMKINSEQEEF
jgi:hypothetical protein